MTSKLVAAVAAFLMVTAAVAAPPAAPGPRAYIVSPAAGDVVPPTFTVRFGLRGMGVAPAGVERAGTGHHHLLIDVDTLPPPGKPLPATDHIRHFGGGQTEVTLTLTPGEHTLQLLLGDHQHVPHNPPVLSDRIRIFVSE